MELKSNLEKTVSEAETPSRTASAKLREQWALEERFRDFAGCHS
jgi:hypothetical protein